MRGALALLEQAGWKVHDQKLVDADGQQFSFEILLAQPTFERIALPYVQWLARLGIAAHVRTVDPAQYEQLVDTYDYDMIVVDFDETESPGNEQTGYWTCDSVKPEGGFNVMGVCNPVIDDLVRQVVSAPDRAHLVVATRALDRVLLAGWYVVPQWYLQSVWVAYWDRFRPAGQAGAYRPRLRQLGGWTRYEPPPPTPPAAACHDTPDRRRAALMGSYLIRRLLLVIPTLFGIITINFVVVQFAPGGPVEQMIAELKGHAGGGVMGRMTGAGGPEAMPVNDGRYRGARGLDPHVVADLKRMFGFDKPAPERFVLMLRGYLEFDSVAASSRDESVLHLVEEKMPVSISLGLWSTLLVYFIFHPAGHRQGGCATAAASTSSAAPWCLIGYAVPGFLFAILLVVLFAGGSFEQWFPLRGLHSAGTESWSFPRPRRGLSLAHGAAPPSPSWSAASPG